MPKKDGTKNLPERNTDPENLAEDNAPSGECDSSDKPARFRNFLCEFYPDDDKHMNILAMLNRYPQMFKVVYILHNKDVWDDDSIKKYKDKHNGDCPYNKGESKKAHIHCLVVNRSPISVSSMSRTLGGLHVKVCRDVDASLRYFIHDTFDSWGKAPYSPDNMFGDSKLISRLAQRNSYYIQLQTLCHLFDSEHGLRSVIDYVADRPEYQETFERFQYLIVACNTDERARTSNSAILDKYIKINKRLLD